MGGWKKEGGGFPKENLTKALLTKTLKTLLPLLHKESRPLRLLNALNSEDRGLKVHFSLATIAFETFES